MEDSVIRVQFIVQPMEDINSSIRAWCKIMPWMKYLVDNNIDFSYDEFYHAAAHQHIVTLKFKLPPEKETYYNLKYR